MTLCNTGNSTVVSKFAQANNKESIKAQNQWHFVRGIHRWPDCCVTTPSQSASYTQFCILMDIYELMCLQQYNKANLKDLIAATGLVILLKLDSNCRFFSPCDLEIWWMTQKNNGAPLLCYFKLFASFRSHWWIQTGVTVQKRLIWVKIYDYFSRVTLKFDGWPSKRRGHLFYATSSLVLHFVAIGEFKL